MTGKQYDRYVSFFRKNPRLIPGLKIVNHILTSTGFVVYPAILLYLIYKKSRKFMSYLLVPAVAYPLSLIFADIAEIRDRQLSGILTLLVSLYTFSVRVLPFLCLRWGRHRSAPCLLSPDSRWKGNES